MDGITGMELWSIQYHIICTDGSQKIAILFRAIDPDNASIGQQLEFGVYSGILFTCTALSSLIIIIDTFRR